MWYKECQQQNKEEIKKQQDDQMNSVDYKLVGIIADRLIRRRLSLKGMVYPQVVYVNGLIKKVCKRLEDKYEDISVIRTKATDEDITPLVASAVNDILK
jgi:hypothetical protein